MLQTRVVFISVRLRSVGLYLCASLVKVLGYRLGVKWLNSFYCYPNWCSQLDEEFIVCYIMASDWNQKQWCIAV